MLDTQGLRLVYLEAAFAVMDSAEGDSGKNPSLLLTLAPTNRTVRE